MRIIKYNRKEVMKKIRTLNVHILTLCQNNDSKYRFILHELIEPDLQIRLLEKKNDL